MTDKGLWERIWEVRWGGILIEDGALSIGRVMMWVVFGLLIYMWLGPGTVPDTLIECFWGLLLYNGGKKVTGPLKEFLIARGTNKGDEKDTGPVEDIAREDAEEAEEEEPKRKVTVIDALG